MQIYSYTMCKVVRQWFEEGKTLKDYIVEYQTRAKDDQIHQLAVLFGLDEDKLRNMMGHKLTDANINEFGRLDDLKKID